MRLLRLILTLLTFASISVPLTSQAASASWKTDSALVFLHRSANQVAPENTVPAFEEAVRQGADGIETDIRKTRDGVFVIYHDDWVMRQRGPAGKIEEMTLEETQHLDVGERFGPRWRGLHPPLFEDLLRFAKANDLRLYLDIKTPKIYDEVMRLVGEQNVLSLVHATGGQVPAGNYHLPIPWISGWNYTEGGEEDPARMRAVIAKAPKGVYGIMCDDARSIVRALGRHPENRPLTRFVSTMPTRLRTAQRQGAGKLASVPSGTELLQELSSAQPDLRRNACLSLSRMPDPAALGPLLALAEHDPDYTVRQDACWALGSLRDNHAAPPLLRIAMTPYDRKTAAQTEYRDFFLKIAAGCALARLNSRAGRNALQTLLNSRAENDAAAAAVGLGAFGVDQDLSTLAALVDSRSENTDFSAEFIVGYIGRFGAKAIPVYLAALSRNNVAKVAVFGLAALGSQVLPAVARLESDPATPSTVRHRCALVRDWLKEPSYNRAR